MIFRVGPNQKYCISVRMCGNNRGAIVRQDRHPNRQEEAMGGEGEGEG